MPVSQRLRQKQATRDALREAALRLFVDEGFHETTVEQISAVVGVTKRTFFLHFASKDEVLLGHVAEQLDLLREVLDSAPMHPHVFGRAGQAVVMLAEQMQARRDLLLELDLLHRVPVLLAASMERFTAFEDAVADAVRGWLLDANQAHSLTAHEQAYAQLVGTVAIATLRSSLIQWRRNGGHDRLAELVAHQFGAVAAGLQNPR